MELLALVLSIIALLLASYYLFLVVRKKRSK